MIGNYSKAKPPTLPYVDLVCRILNLGDPESVLINVFDKPRP